MARLTALENRLRRDTQGIERDQLLARLQTGEQQLRQQLLLSQEQQRQQLALLLNACTASSEVISALWGRYHGH
ncbi:EscE/YscE/SsaE family type III secretion system needle protein co-chaperone [Winslowiella toletana]|uniref:EscE/YscE/SsaE family type III secretion system needle protein co-chaperone n=1 Tax=Winslowiella toletana TaxID=92490 RepID=UPI0028BD5009|nr:EscE/YscE/SsaE family type III secretion system needle protein co-chaperone [Winslowiella toletana]WNN43860.1 EscE/YscE/SsaE family type III secretion system needle protein co-chaperone [Winslowiella toletana]